MCCGYVARSALEVDDSSEVRIEKICNIIAQCRWGIHDLSRTDLDPEHHLPRFNMPLELGIFLGAKRLGTRKQRDKSALVLDVERYRYHKFISDISGQDIKAHGNDLRRAVTCVRDWLPSVDPKTTQPGAGGILVDYAKWRQKLPEFCAERRLMPQELTFNDKTNLIYIWLEETRAKRR